MPILPQQLACASYVISDAAIGLCGKLGLSFFTNGKRHARYAPEKSADYIEWYVSLFEDLLRGGGRGGYRGDVCELGPGDSLAGGVLYRLRGADSVTFFERFQRQDDPARERRVGEIVYQREIDRQRLAAQKNFAEQSNSAKESNFAAQSLDEITDAFRLVQGVAAETHLANDPACYDLILSNSVFQHVSDPLPLLQLCYDRLKPGGRMLHVIDLRNLGLLKQWGELAWLETPPALHRLMVRNTGRPNRVRFRDYREWAESIDGEFSVRIRHLVGSNHPWGDIPPEEVPTEAWDASRELVRAARPRFTPSLRSHSSRDHAVATFLLCVAKCPA